MNEELAQQILDSITSYGDAKTKVKHIIGGNLSHILSISSGSPRIQTNVIKRFKLILSQPKLLKRLNPFEIRCSFCSKVISYPCWYYNVKYAVNHFHYFVCFQPSADNTKPNTNCYRKD